jgi:Zn-dependent M28 family amino/carboxypeptidase
VHGRPSRNVIAERSGTAAAPRDVVIVTARLDSINVAGGPAAPAPGPDDNGSGSAGVLAIARAMQHHRGMLDTRFILFGGEEQGLFGSLAYVASLSAAERSRIRAVVNMDMIATVNTPVPTVLLEEPRCPGM